jgi:hypothetical protein
METRTNGRVDSTATSGAGAINWIERKPPTKFEFGPGAVLVGLIVNHDKRKVRDQRTGEMKPVNRYTVEDAETKERVFFHATVQLDDALGPADVGRFVSITCTGEDKEAGRNGNAMKTFKVMVSQQYAPGWANDGTPIGDDDIGF